MGIISNSLRDTFYLIYPLILLLWVLGRAFRAAILENKMSRADNIHKTSVTLDTDTMSVIVKILLRTDDSVVAEETFSAAEIHDSIKQQVSLYGYSKLLQDRASDVPIGPEKLDAMKAVAAQLASGQWAKERKVGAIIVSPAVEALAALKQISVPAAQAALKAYPKEVREQILGNEAIVAKAAEITAARAEADVASLDDMLPATAVEAEVTPAVQAE